MRKKTIIITIITLLIIVLIAILVYSFLSKEEPGMVFDSTFSSPEEILAENPEEKGKSPLLQLSSSPVLGFKVLDNSIITVLRNGSIDSMSLLGDPIENVINIGSIDIVEVQIGPNGNLIALHIDEGDKYGRWLLFNKEEGLESLATNIRDVSFSPAGKVLLLRDNGGDYSLVIRDGEKETILSKINIPDMLVNWVDEETIAITTKPSGLATSILYFLNTKSQRIERIIGSEFGLTSQVSPNKEWLLFSKTNSNGRGSVFKIKSLKKDSISTVFFDTLPEKCSFSQDTRFAFCSLFKNSSTGSIMPDDYYKGVFSTPSSVLSRINLETGRIEEDIENLFLDVTYLQLSNNEDALFFIDKNSENLYRFKI